MGKDEKAACNQEQLNSDLLKAIRDQEPLPQIRKLVRRGGDVNSRDSLDQTGLILALSRCSKTSGPPLVAYLFECGADPTLMGAMNCHPLNVAAKSGIARNLIMVILELQNRQALTQELLNGALVMAVEKQSPVEIVDALLQSGAQAKVVAEKVGPGLALGVSGAIETALLQESKHPSDQQLGTDRANKRRFRERGMIP